MYDQAAGRVQGVKAAITGDKPGQVSAAAQVSRTYAYISFYLTCSTLQEESGKAAQKNA